MKYYNVKVKPDQVNGDVSPVIDSDASHNAFAAGDLLFDWTAFYIPKGTSKLENIALYMSGADGGAPVAGDIHLIFARDVDGVAPLSAGTINGVGVTTCFNLATNFLGAVVMEGSTTGVGKIKGPAHGGIYTMTRQSTNGAMMANLMLEGEGDSTKPGYSKAYVCGVADGNFVFQTNVLSNAAVSDATAATATTGIVVKTGDVRKTFQKGDTVYIHDVDVAIGVVKSVPDATTLILESANVGAIAENDEFINANPIKISLGLCQG